MDKTAKAAARVALGGSSQGKQLSGPLDLIFDQLEEVGKSARRLQSSVDQSSKSLVGLSANLRAFSHFIGEMAVLEEKMQAISAAGRDLVERLLKRDEDEAVDRGRT